MCCSPWGFRVRQDLATQQQLIFISILMAYTFKYCFLSVNHGKVIFILDQGERNTFFIFKSKQPLLKAVVLTQLCKATVIILYLFKKRDAYYRLGFYEFGGILFYFVWVFRAIIIWGLGGGGFGGVFLTPCSMRNFYNQGSNLSPLQWKQWKHRVLTTGPPG